MKSNFIKSKKFISIIVGLLCVYFVLMSIFVTIVISSHIGKVFPGFGLHRAMFVLVQPEYRWHGYENDVQIGDVVKKVNGQDVKTVRQVYELIRKHDIGEIINYEINRNGKIINIGVPLSKFTVIDFAIIYLKTFVSAIIIFLIGVFGYLNRKILIKRMLLFAFCLIFANYNLLIVPIGTFGYNIITFNLFSNFIPLIFFLMFFYIFYGKEKLKKIFKPLITLFFIFIVVPSFILVQLVNNVESSRMSFMLISGLSGLVWLLALIKSLKNVFAPESQLMRQNSKSHLIVLLFVAILPLGNILFTILFNTGFPFYTFTIMYIIIAFHINNIFDKLELSNRLNEANKYLKQKNSVISNQIYLAKDIQKKIISKSKKIFTSDELQVANIYHPLEEIGGDYFDIRIVSEKQYSIILTDVSGHGVPAAFVTAMVKILFDLAPKDFLRFPKGFMQFLNINLLNKVASHFLTSIVCYFDLANRKLHFSNAAHYEPLIYRKKTNEIITFVSKYDLIGVFSFAKYGEEITDIHPQDRILLFTDGFLTAISPQCRPSEGLEIIKKFIRKNPDLSITDFIDRLNLLINENKSKDFHDDITLVAIDIN